MNRSALLMLSCFVLVACQQEMPASPAPEMRVAAAQAPKISGKQAYEQVCARCHESGLDGAPRTDHPEDWSGRSRLWQAVLYEHARQGYLGMPAKGGDDRLNDKVVSAAAEYMLERTYPGLPVD